MSRRAPSRVASDAGSICSEARELFTEQASEACRHASDVANKLMRTPLRCVAVGSSLMVLPVAACIIAPLLILFAPLLLSLGFGLTAFGVVRAGLIVVLRGPANIAIQRAQRRLASATASGPQSSSVPPVRREVTQQARVESFMRPKVCGGSRLPPALLAQDGSLRELNDLAAKRGGSLVKEVSAVVRTNLVRATRDISGEVEVHLHAMQEELQSWAGANPNLKPYCYGQIGWLLRQEAREASSNCATPSSAAAAAAAQSCEAKDRRDSKAAGGDSARSPPTPSTCPTSPDGAPARRGWSPRQRPDLDLTSVFTELLDRLPPPAEMLTSDSLEALPLPPGVEWAHLGFLLVPGLLTKWCALRPGSKLCLWSGACHAMNGKRPPDRPLMPNR